MDILHFDITIALSNKNNSISSSSISISIINFARIAVSTYK